MLTLTLLKKITLSQTYSQNLRFKTTTLLLVIIFVHLHHLSVISSVHYYLHGYLMCRACLVDWL